MFTELKLIILIQLRDPAVQEAKCIADLLLSPNIVVAQQIAARILAKNCRDVLFTLDGWDELTPKLCNDSIFHQLIQSELSQKNPLHERAVIVTS